MKSPLSHTPIRLLKPDDESMSAFERYGLHPKCRACLALDECPNPTYDAPNSNFVYCKDFKNGRRSHKTANQRS